MEKPIIEIKNLTKIFRVPLEKRETLKSYFINPFKRSKIFRFHALDDVTIQIRKGEFVGFLGRNGSGKSTLLKMIAQIYSPTTGKVHVHGSLVPFLELGVGFNSELTGRENIYLNGTILGMSRKYLEQKFDEIVDFSEIREFLDLQLKNYSSGMRIRLAFSIAIQSKADIFLLDEVLAVGDAAFQKKSLAKMRELLSGGATVLFVSHSMDYVEKYCSRVIVMDHGKVIYDGNTKEGIRTYQLSLMSPDQQKEFLHAEKVYKKMMGGKEGEVLTSMDKLNKVEALDVDRGDGRADILEVKLFDSKGKETRTLEAGEKFKVFVRFRVNANIQDPTLGVSFRNIPTYNLFGMHVNVNDKNRLPPLKRTEEVEFTFEDKVLLNPGEYDLQLQVGEYKNSDLSKTPSLYLSYFRFMITGPQKDYWGVVYNDPKFSYKVIKHE